jgi:hypothetical protein
MIKRKRTKGQKGKQRFTKHSTKIKDQATGRLVLIGNVMLRNMIHV